VLISGTGDGGLQDFLRVMTRRRSARQIYHELKLTSNGPRLDLLHSLENRMERAAAWANDKTSPYPFTSKPYLAERHKEILKEADRLIDDQAFHDRVLKCLERRPAMTYLISAEEYLGSFYGLNLFLALLLIRAVKRSPKPKDRESLKVYSGRKIVAIDAADPHSLHPPLSAEDCVGRDWYVRLERVTPTLRANVVILRHGLSETFEDSPPPDPARVHPRPLPPTHLHHTEGAARTGRPLA
jgi:hypothetical protein